MKKAAHTLSLLPLISTCSMTLMCFRCCSSYLISLGVSSSSYFFFSFFQRTSQMMSRMMSTTRDIANRAAQGVTSMGAAGEITQQKVRKWSVDGSQLEYKVDHVIRGEPLDDTRGSNTTLIPRLTVHWNLQGAGLLSHVVARRAPVDSSVVHGEVPQSHHLGVLEIYTSGRREDERKGNTFLNSSFLQLYFERHQIREP